MSQRTIDFYNYNNDQCFYSHTISLAEAAAFDRTNTVSWISITGIKSMEDIQEAADIFHLHPLVVEDILHTQQRAKIEDYHDFYFVVLRMFALMGDKVEDQQVSFVVKDNLVVAFREKDFGIFKKQLGDKLVNATAYLRKQGEDFLLYKLLDTIIDNYYYVLQHYDQCIEEIDKSMKNKADDRVIVKLQGLKDEILYLRKNILPVRDLINSLIRTEFEFFQKDNKYYLRDLHDHMQRNIEEIDFQREQVNSLMDFYYQVQTHKMNNVMKTLTIVSFVFLPLTFIASLYGMNFIHMPRAHDYYGFWEVLGGMGILAAILVAYAFSRQWLSSKDFLKDKYR